MEGGFEVGVIKIRENAAGRIFDKQVAGASGFKEEAEKFLKEAAAFQKYPGRRERFLVKNFASHGPTLSTDSIAAAKMLVSTMSIELGTIISPLLAPIAEFKFISILPILPEI